MTDLILIVVLLCAVTSAAADRPNYITDEEFAKVRGSSIPISNSSVLTLPKLDERPPISARPGFGPRLWTNAKVPYTLDSTFNDSQRAQVALAIQAYHDFTCIRFIPKQSSDTSWVDILLDPNTCGVANLCMNDGGEYAKFGEGVMRHELGHTLCMGHEQSRRDRDEWIGFDTNICNAPSIDGPDFNRGLHKLYDYVSIEHYEGECYSGCFKPKQEGVTKCGSGGALSVLDIEILNEMYGCDQGCLGYHYMNSGNPDLANNNPVWFGNETDGDPLYSCRTYHQGDIIPGKYHMGRGECYVAYGGWEYTYSQTDTHIEVLTNPNNNANLQWKYSDSLPGNAIRGGRSKERETLYPISCLLDIDLGGGNTTQAWTPGKYHPSGGGAYASYGGNEIKCTNFEYLFCT